MRTKNIFIILTLLFLALTVKVFIFPGASQWITAAIMAVTAVVLALTYISAIRPISILASGMDLLKGQDYASRLAPVGQYDADNLVAIFNEMIQRLKDERMRLQEQETFLSLLIEASPVGIIIYDFDGNVSLMNPAAEKLVHGELSEAIRTVPQGKNITLRLGDDSIFRVSRLFFMEMGFKRSFVLVESLTEEVSHAERDAYGKVIRMISHEVNNSMAGMKSLMETLAYALESDKEMCELIDSCHERCTSLSRFITSYANVVKIPAADTKPHDLSAFLLRQRPFLEAMAGHGITIRYRLHTEAVTAPIDAPLLEQAIVNIVKNAIESIMEKHGGNGDGAISIITLPHPPTIEILDNGTGIAPEISGRLFTPFLSTKSNGQGLGLMMTGEILKKHGCRYSLSPAGGNLTRFRIIFPA